MSEPVTAMRKLTFHTGLPVGTRATFTHEGEPWIALPAAKYVATLTICDNLIGNLQSIRHTATKWLAANPGDVQRAGMLLAVIARADKAAETAALEKVSVQTAIGGTA